MEARWGLVSSVLRALTRFGPWRLDGSSGPMHKWYDPRLFEMLSEDEIKEAYAPKSPDGKFRDVRTGADLAEACFDVRLIGGQQADDMPEGGGEPREDEAEVDESVFCRWVQWSACRRGEAVGRWWAYMKVSGGEEQAGPKTAEEDTPVDLLRQIRADVDGAVTVRALVRWLAKQAGVADVFGADAGSDAEQLLFEDVF